MKKWRTAGLAAACLIMVFAVIARAVPPRVNYQGRLMDSSGMPVSGAAVDMGFALYAVSSGGTALWAETQSGVSVEQGLYNVRLGASNSLDSSLFAGSTLWLEVAVDGETLSPRQPVASAPYAFAADFLTRDIYLLNSGDTVNGDLDINGTLRIGPQAADSVGIQFSSTISPDYGAFIFGKQIALYAGYTGSSPMNIGALGLVNSGVYGAAGDSVSGSMMVGGNFSGVSRGLALGVSAGADGYGSSPARAVMGIATGHGTSEASGGYFVAMSGGTGQHFGVVGRSMDTTGEHIGVYGQSASPEGYGVFSQGNAYMAGSVFIEGIAQDRTNKKQIGALKWFEANERTDVLTGVAYFAASFDGANSVAVSTFGNSFVSRFSLDAENRADLSISASAAPGIAYDGRHYWVSMTGSSQVRRIGSSPTNVTVGSGPAGVAFDGRYLWVANMGNNNVSIVDPFTATQLTQLSAGTSPYWVAVSYDRVWVTNSNSANVTVFNKYSMAVAATYPLTGDPRGIAFDGQNMWIACGAANVVRKLRESDGLNLGSYPAGGNVYGVVFDGAHVWVTGSGSNSVMKLRAVDGHVLGMWTVCNTPRMPAFDGVHVWIPCAGTGGGVRKM